MKEKLETLKAKLKDIRNLHAAKAVLGWDQQACMPSGGAEARAEQIAALSRIAHDMFIADDIGVLLTDLAKADFPCDSDEAGLVRVARLDYDHARKLPSELVEKMNRTFSPGRQDKSVHPFTTSFSINDVRITGMGLDARPYLNYITQKYSEIYDLP